MDVPRSVSSSLSHTSIIHIAWRSALGGVRTLKCTAYIWWCTPLTPIPIVLTPITEGQTSS
jgi:hypothetical protein